MNPETRSEFLDETGFDLDHLTPQIPAEELTLLRQAVQAKLEAGVDPLQPEASGAGGLAPRSLWLLLGGGVLLVTLWWWLTRPAPPEPVVQGPAPIALPLIAVPVEPPPRPPAESLPAAPPAVAPPPPLAPLVPTAPPAVEEDTTGEADTQEEEIPVPDEAIAPPEEPPTAPPEPPPPATPGSISDEVTLLQESLAAQERGDLDTARKHLEDYLERFARGQFVWEARCALLRTHVLQQDWGRAAALGGIMVYPLRQQGRIDEVDPAVITDLARALIELGRYEAALSLLDARSTLNQNHRQLRRQAQRRLP